MSPLEDVRPSRQRQETESSLGLAFGRAGSLPSLPGSGTNDLECYTALCQCSVTHLSDLHTGFHPFCLHGCHSGSSCCNSMPDRAIHKHGLTSPLHSQTPPLTYLLYLLWLHKEHFFGSLDNWPVMSTVKLLFWSVVQFPLPWQ